MRLHSRWGEKNKALSETCKSDTGYSIEVQHNPLYLKYTGIQTGGVSSELIGGVGSQEPWPSVVGVWSCKGGTVWTQQ